MNDPLASKDCEICCGHGWIPDQELFYDSYTAESEWSYKKCVACKGTGKK